AHCSFAMLGGFVTVSLTNGLGWPFLASLPVAFASAALVSVAFERVLYRRLYGASELDQCLLTIGIVFVSVAVAAYIFGTIQQPLNLPAYLRGSVSIFGHSFGVYRLFLIGVSIVITAVLVAALEYTRFGAQVRAAVDNQRMARGLGIDVDRVFAVTFALGSGLAGLGGALAIEIVGLDHAFAFTYLIYVLIVVAVGGLGSLRGLVRRPLPARHQRHGGQVLFSRARRVSDLFRHGGAIDVAAGRPVRETLGGDVFRGR